MKEIKAGEPGDPAVKWLTHEGQQWVVEVPHINSVIAGWDLGCGESDVLTWAFETPGCGAILDDRAARKCAQALGIPVRGTIGVLLAAKRKRLIESVTPLLDQLGALGFRIHPSLVDEARRLAGE